MSEPTLPNMTPPSPAENPEPIVAPEEPEEAARPSKREWAELRVERRALAKQLAEATNVIAEFAAIQASQGEELDELRRRFDLEALLGETEGLTRDQRAILRKVARVEEPADVSAWLREKIWAMSPTSAPTTARTTGAVVAAKAAGIAQGMTLARNGGRKS